MKVIALIPARSGSKRIPNKNIKELCGSPLMVHSIITAMACSEIDDVWVSTDSENYMSLAGVWGAKAYKRNPKASSDSATDEDVVNDFLLMLNPLQPHLIVYLRPTTPFRQTSMVNIAIKIMRTSPYDSLRSVEEMSESAFKCFGIKGGFLKPLSKKDYTDYPNQKLPKTYKPNGYVDIIRPNANSLWGEKRYAFITPPTPEIDTLYDWDKAEWYGNNKPQVWGKGIK